MNLQGKALASIKNLDEKNLKEVNGVIGWCKLAQEVTAMTSQRLQGLANKVYAPKKVKKYSDVMSALEDWELQVKIFETSEDRKLSDPTKIYSVRQLVPDELEKDLIRINTMTDYEVVRAYICEQVTVRRDVKNTSTGPVGLDTEGIKKTLANLWSGGEGHQEAEEEDEEECGVCGGKGQGQESQDEAIGQLLSFVKGMKGGKGGKGKGGQGGGKFEGNCHHCGVFGHRIAECWKKDQDVAKGKGKGKGKDGKDGGYGGGFGKGGYGKGFGGYGKGNNKGGYGKGGYGKAYSLDDFYDEAAKSAGRSWTLSMTKLKEHEAPPGLHPQGKARTMWEALESDDKEDENDDQRKSDLKEMEKELEKEYPKPQMMNYSKKKVRELQGEKKVRFEPMRNSTNKSAKPTPLNMFVKTHDKGSDDTVKTEKMFLKELQFLSSVLWTLWAPACRWEIAIISN